MIIHMFSKKIHSPWAFEKSGFRSSKLLSIEVNHMLTPIGSILGYLRYLVRDLSFFLFFLFRSITFFFLGSSSFFLLTISWLFLDLNFLLNFLLSLSL